MCFARINTTMLAIALCAMVLFCFLPPTQAACYDTNGDGVLDTCSRWAPVRSVWGGERVTVSRPMLLSRPSVSRHVVSSGSSASALSRSSGSYGSAYAGPSAVYVYETSAPAATTTAPAPAASAPPAAPVPSGSPPQAAATAAPSCAGQCTCPDCQVRARLKTDLFELTAAPVPPARCDAAAPAPPAQGLVAAPRPPLLLLSAAPVPPAPVAMVAMR